jgi:hypothetical protein
MRARRHKSFYDGVNGLMRAGTVRGRTVTDEATAARITYYWRHPEGG